MKLNEEILDSSDGPLRKKYNPLWAVVLGVCFNIVFGSYGWLVSIAIAFLSIGIAFLLKGKRLNAKKCYLIALSVLYLPLFADLSLYFFNSWYAGNSYLRLGFESGLSAWVITLWLGCPFMVALTGWLVWPKILGNTIEGRS